MTLRQFLKSATRYLEAPRIIYDREGKDPYLSRYYLVRSKPTEDMILKGQAASAIGERAFDMFLHHFHRGDGDQALHNHPWEWGFSFILVGGYIEERREGDRVVTRRVLPFTFNIIRKDDYHRVDLIEEDAWSLFLVGPRVDTWYFWDRVKKARMEWRAFIEAKRLGVEGTWFPDLSPESERQLREGLKAVDEGRVSPLDSSLLADNETAAEPPTMGYRDTDTNWQLFYSDGTVTDTGVSTQHLPPTLHGRNRVAVPGPPDPPPPPPGTQGWLKDDAT